MIGSCNCPITGVQLQPTVPLHCPITTLQIVIVMISLLMVHVTLQIMTCLISK